MLQQENKQLRLRIGEHAKPRDQVAQLQAPAAQASTSTASNSYFAGMAGMMKDPQMKEMVRAQQKMALNKTYGALFNVFEPASRPTGCAEGPIVDHQMAMMNAGMAMTTGSGSESDRKQAAENSKTINSDYDKKMQGLLGQQNYQAFQDYEKTLPERYERADVQGHIARRRRADRTAGADLMAACRKRATPCTASSPLNSQNQTPNR